MKSGLNPTRQKKDNQKMDKSWSKDTQKVDKKGTNNTPENHLVISTPQSSSFHVRGHQGSLQVRNRDPLTTAQQAFGINLANFKATPEAWVAH